MRSRCCNLVHCSANTATGCCHKAIADSSVADSQAIVSTVLCRPALTCTAKSCSQCKTVCNLPAQQVRVNLWDLAGPTDYLEVRNEFYKDSQAAILVYDATDRSSFEALTNWLEESQKYGAPGNMVRGWALLPHGKLNLTLVKTFK